MKASRALSETLGRLGVREVFGNPGTTELPFLEGVDQRYILALHDGLAIGMAEGAALVDRRPAFANLHASPGLGNAVAYLDTARRDRAPLLVTVGQQDQRHHSSRPLLFAPLDKVAGGVVKSFEEPHSPAEVEPAIRRAWRIAMTPPFGPALVSLPMDVMESESAEGGDAPEQAPVAGAPELSHASRRLAESRSVTIVAGYEVDLFGAFEEVEALAHRLGAPVFAEPLCSRAPVSGEGAHFVQDLLPASALINAALAEHDTILLVGGDLTLYPYTGAPLLPGKSVIYLGADPEIAAKFPELSLLGPLKPTARGLLDALPAPRRSFSRLSDLSRANRIARSAPRMGGEFVLDAIRRAFADHTVVDETVSFTPALKWIGFYHGPDSYFASRSGQLGWALPAAAGIGLRRPRTLAIVGDGALLYAPQSLWTMRRYSVPVKVVVLNNHGYSILKSYSRSYHPSIASSDYLDLPLVDVLALARSFGVEAESVAAPAELDAALARLRASEGPALLNVEVDRDVPNLFG